MYSQIYKDNQSNVVACREWMTSENWKNKKVELLLGIDKMNSDIYNRIE
jgi:hypothetical protein